MKNDELYKYLDTDGSFEALNPQRTGYLYFPLANELGLLSAITPELYGDIKLDQHSFLTLPVSIEDLKLNRASRGFWVGVFKSGVAEGRPDLCWSVNGASHWQKELAEGEESVSLKAGILWQEVTRRNSHVGLEATVLNFVPSSSGTFEIMMVAVKNVSKSPLTLVGTSAIPLYARSADNLRDHRHVTSLLNRIKHLKHGVCVQPTMSFNERGHKFNHTQYYAVGADENGQAPVGIFPTLMGFTGEAGDLEKPEAVFEGKTPAKKIDGQHQGKEAMGALQFSPQHLEPGASVRYVLLLGIDADGINPDQLIHDHGRVDRVQQLLQENKAFWDKKSRQIEFQTGDLKFNQWMKWVTIQPSLRKIYGCSFLPDFDYGRGGRGWRDLWQDCLALLLGDAGEARTMILNNFGGVRLDGSNATIIGRKKRALGKDDSQESDAQASSAGSKIIWDPEFIADRNNITRTWMDHGTWPYITTELYLNQTGDWDVLLEKIPYFRDAQLRRGKKLDLVWLKEQSTSDLPAEVRTLQRTKLGNIYYGSVLEHILVEHLVQFFNVGEHNFIRLEDADWNDGLDLAPERGESVTFTALYAGNIEALADLLESAGRIKGWKDIAVAEEMVLLVDRAGSKVNYDAVDDKRRRLEEYYQVIESGIKGQQASLPLSILINDLRAKATWSKKHINESEWIKAADSGWFNGYYDNQGRRVEGAGEHGIPRMTLTGQVYPIMSAVADEPRIKDIVKAVNKHLWDKELGGIRLNTDFGQTQPDLGRGFSFVYGEKENGAIFSHMVVMYAYALYKRGLVEEGHRALQSLYKLAEDSKRSKIFPCIPEYFNGEGRGRYLYLTGSASWYIYTLLTQVFGVRGHGGDLLLAPKLEPEQYDEQGTAAVEFTFAGARIKVEYQNPGKIPFDKAVVDVVETKVAQIPVSRLSDREVLVHRELLSQQKEWHLIVKLVSGKK